MKIILSSRRHHYLGRVSTFFIAVALVVGLERIEHGKLHAAFRENWTIINT